MSDFLESNDFEYLNSRSAKNHTLILDGFNSFNTYIKGGMENENFKAYAPEDKERYYRYTTLGYKVGRITDYIYHLEHSRGENSWFSNPHMTSNNDEWEKIQRMNKEQLIEYYSGSKIFEEIQ